jgi:hypothetical protein
MVYIGRRFSRVFRETTVSEEKRLVNSAIILNYY